MGIPIFAHGGGLGYVLQPTFGYLLGFVFGAYVIGRLTERRKLLKRTYLLLALVAGTMAIYLLGVSVLYLNLNLVQQKAVSLSTAVKIGFILPLPGDLIKIAVVLYLGPLMHQRFRLARMDVSG